MIFIKHKVPQRVLRHLFSSVPIVGIKCSLQLEPAAPQSTPILRSHTVKRLECPSRGGEAVCKKLAKLGETVGDGALDVPLITHKTCGTSKVFPMEWAPVGRALAEMSAGQRGLAPVRSVPYKLFYL